MSQLRDATEADVAAILALNDAEVQQTSPMSRDQLRVLAQMAAYCRVATVDGQVAAFLIALREGAPYANENYGWFAARYARFLYVDRVVVGAAFAGKRIGSALYDALFAAAAASRVPVITCEYNLQPPNPASRAFHAKYGFREVGTQWVAGGTKQVSLQAANPGQVQLPRQ